MIISNEQFTDAYNKLPFPIREFLAGNDLAQITEGVGQQYGLHVDTVGALEREITNMLLGYLSPAQFVGELKSVGVPEESVSTIVKELNARVFMPLREKMQNPSSGTTGDEDEEETVSATPPTAAALTSYAIPSTAAFVPSAAPTYAPPTPANPAPSYTNPNSMAAIPSAQNTPEAFTPSAYVPPTRPSVSEFSKPLPPLAPQARPIESNVPFAPQTSAASVAPSIPAQASASIPTPPISISSTNPQLRPDPYAAVLSGVHVPARTMAQDMQAAQMQPKTAQPQPAPASVWTPPVATTPAPAPIQNPTPTPPVSSAPLSPQQTANRDALHSVLKEYGVDPYREPPV